MVNTKYIYLFTNGKHIKIGATNNLVKRYKTLKTASPYLKLIFTVKLPQYKLVETVLHRNYKHKLVSGEWYDLDSIDIEQIKNTLWLMIKLIIDPSESAVDYFFMNHTTFIKAMNNHEFVNE